MNNDHDTERLFIGRFALMLFVGGLLIPFILVVLVLALGSPNLSSEAKSTAYGLISGFGLVAEVLALIFGIIGRRYLSGKTALVGVIVLVVSWIVLGILGSAVWFVLTRPPTPEIKGGSKYPKGTEAKADTVPAWK
jgi:ABC-type transport system involved in multi-copper enzyme maturation permease subunit